jgi:hypothetical protein
VLDLDAVAPPPPPPSHAPRHRTLMAKMPADLVEWARHQAALEHVAVNTWLKRVVQRERDGALPEDCVEWLVKQAAQCGTPGDPHGALVEVIRHLAGRWPNGGRLRP